MNPQPNLELEMKKSHESVLKRMDENPSNGATSVMISGGQIQSRIEIPATVQRPDLMELGYTMAVAANITGTAGVAANGVQANTINALFLPANYLPEIARIEIRHADSTENLVDISNFDKYSRMSCALFNDFKDRCLNERVNFRRDFSSQILAYNSDGTVSTPAVPAIPPGLVNNTTKIIYPSNADSTNSLVNSIYGVFYNGNEILSDGYFNSGYPATITAAGGVGNNLGVQANNTYNNIVLPDAKDCQQEYLSMGSIQSVDGTGTVILKPNQYTFNFRLGDVIHDSWLNNKKHYYHSSNLVIIITWNIISNTLLQLPVSVSYTQASPSVLSVSPLKTGDVSGYPGNVGLNLTNIFVRYHQEQNKEIVQYVKEKSYDFVYPYIHQTQGTSSGTQSTTTLMIGPEKDTRIYRMYCALFNQTNGFVADNCNNVGYSKWSNNVELYFDNDLYARYNTNYQDWYNAMKAFKNSSLTSASEIQHQGVVVFNFDSNYENGEKDEYAWNTLKGKELDRQININPRFLKLNTDGQRFAVGNINYVEWLFAVTLRTGRNEKGRFNRAN